MWNTIADARETSMCVVVQYIVLVHNRKEFVGVKIAGYCSWLHGRVIVRDEITNQYSNNPSCSNSCFEL